MQLLKKRKKEKLRKPPLPPPSGELRGGRQIRFTSEAPAPLRSLEISPW